MAEAETEAVAVEVEGEAEAEEEEEAAEEEAMAKAVGATNLKVDLQLPGPSRARKSRRKCPDREIESAIEMPYESCEIGARVSEIFTSHLGWIGLPSQKEKKKKKIPNPQSSPSSLPPKSSNRSVFTNDRLSWGRGVDGCRRIRSG